MSKGSRALLRWILIGLSCALGVWLAVKYLMPIIMALIFGVWIVFFAPSDVTSELQRAPSPDRTLDAVLVETQPGFVFEDTVTYQVYVVRAGSKQFYGKSAKGQVLLPVLDGFGDGLTHAQLIWRGPNFLEIRYSSACIDTFRNHWCSADLDNCKRVVAIRLRPPDDDSAHLCQDWSR